MKQDRGDLAAPSVVKKTLSSEEKALFKSALHPNPLEKGFNWILDNMSEKHEPIELAGRFLEKYESQIEQMRPQVLEGCRHTFRAALLVRCLKVLPFFQVRFADKAYNPTFLRTWFQKRLYARLLGISEKDVELKIRNSGKTPPRFLEEQLEKLLALGCLKNLE